MSIIHLTDTAARIASLVEDRGISTISLEWGGPNDRAVTDFDLAQLGEVTASGGNARAGWVVLAGRCLLQVGDTIPLVSTPMEWIATSVRYIAAANATVVTAALESADGQRRADRVTTIHHDADADEIERNSDVDTHVAQLNAEMAAK